MPIVKRRLDICGREKSWEYLIENVGQQYRVTARQVGPADPEYTCSCGTDLFPRGGSLQPPYEDFYAGPCSHICEVQRDLSIARQAAAQMIP